MLGAFLIFFGFLGVFLSIWPFAVFPSSVSGGVSFGGLFCFDWVSYSLSILNILICLSLSFWFFSVSLFSRLMLGVSLFSSLLCYSCVHALWFWVFYEMSIVPLLILLAVDSPYSERYVALWYFSGYVVLSSLPMLLCFFYFSSVFGGFDVRLWCSSSSDVLFCVVGVLLGVLFVTKIPLVPFHVWLPIVHAESSSPVSVCLSGFIMKLGLLGVFRFCFFLVPSPLFGVSYVVVCLLCSIVFFLSALRELDVKRWLALVSLGHIAIAVSCLSVGGWKVSFFCFSYSLGHGLSAAVMFIFLWLISDLASSRNVILMKHTVWASWVSRFFFCLSVGTVCCTPPTIQFFSELFLMVELFWFSGWVLTLALYFYLFLGGLIPIVLLGVCLTRHYDVSYSGEMYSRLPSVGFLLFWSFALFLVC